MEKHGGQFFEGPDEVLVCVVDDSYGKPSDLEEELHEWFKSELENEFSQIFEEVDVAPGYSVPAFATLVQVVSDYWPALVATFFLAKPVSENLEVWIRAAKTIRCYFVRPDIVLGRNAAAALAIEAVFEDMGGIPKTIECVGYHWRDRRFSEDEIDTSERQKIERGPRTEYLSMAIQVFKIRADRVEYEVIIDGKSVSARRI